MENFDWSQIAGNTQSAPYINSLLTRPDASYAKNFHNVLPSETTSGYLHPSEPNYIWLEAGTNRLPDHTFTTSDPPSPSNSTSSTAHLVTYLNNAGISWKAYEEDISGTDCPTTEHYPYAPRHNPFIFFQDVTNDGAYCISHVRPFTELATDLANNAASRYNFITPNLCNDMHDAAGCSGATGDAILNGDNWLKSNLPTLFDSSTYKNGGAIFVIWDEDSGDTTNNPIGMIVLSPFAKGNGYNNTIAYSFSSLIRTLQEIFGVSPFLANAAFATDLSDLFTPSPTPTPTHTPTSTNTSTPTPTNTPTPTPTVAAPSPAEFLKNGSFEDGFRINGVADSWFSFNNGGERVSFSYHDDTWTRVLTNGAHSQLIEIDATKFSDTPLDRFSGIGQTVSGLVPGGSYQLVLNGVIRTSEGDRNTDNHSYLVQWGIDPNGGSDWQVVKDWKEVPWYHVYYRLSPGPQDQYATAFQAPSAKITLFIRLLKTQPTPFNELDLNLDALSLWGPK